MPSVRSMFDPNAVFRVRRPFLFAGMDFVDGDKFCPTTMEASSRKVRNLWEARKIEVVSRDEDIAKLNEPAPVEEKPEAPADSSVEKMTGGWYLIKHPSLPPEGKKVQGQRSVDELLATLKPVEPITPEPEKTPIVVTPAADQTEHGKEF